MDMQHSDTDSRPGRLYHNQGFPIGKSLLFALCIVLIAVFGTAQIAVDYFLVVMAAMKSSPLFTTHAPVMQTVKEILSNNVNAFIIQGISDLVLAAFIVWKLPGLAKQNLSTLGFRMPTLRELGYGLLGVIASYALVTVIQIIIEAVTHTHPHQQTVDIIRQLSPNGVRIAAVVAIVIAPITEELVFRVFLYNAFERYLPVALAIGISGSLFGAVHGDLLIIPELAATGMVLAVVYAKTRCVWSNILTHALFNSIAFIAIFIFHQKN